MHKIFFYIILRYSHGAVVQLSNLKEAIEPDYNGIKVGSRILMKIKPPDDEVTKFIYCKIFKITEI